jgi:hypothetical protein
MYQVFDLRASSQKVDPAHYIWQWQTRPLDFFDVSSLRGIAKGKYGTALAEGVIATLLKGAPYVEYRMDLRCFQSYSMGFFNLFDYPLTDEYFCQKSVLR